MRIAFVARRFGARFGGAEAYGERVLAELAQRHDIHVFCQEWDSPLPLAHTLVGCNRRLPRWLNLLDFGRRCAPLLRGFDVVHSHENLWLGDVQVVHVMPVRYSRLHNPPSWRRRLRSLTSMRWLTYLALEALRVQARPQRTVVAASALIAQQLSTAYARMAPVQVITPGVQLPAQPRDQAAARARLGLTPGRVYLLLIANDPVRKGLDAALDALARLPERTQLLVVGGDAATAERVRASALASNVAARVQAWPGQRDVDVFYDAADICLFATLGDAFGMVPLEAMAHGLPVILSPARYCGFAGHLMPERDALVLDDPRDSGEIAHAVRRLMDDPALCEALVAAGHRVAQTFGWRTIAAQFEHVYLADARADVLLPSREAGGGEDTIAGSR
ncbi:glycosyltransferase family 4 protein [Verticiella sediminum]|uniref:Glycosyltransferase family 4 protein n=1 Tax=Verticiella sediminum TaxID=1247510 RepID=A0A556AU63_9BURK|nr:glycosyltransferase family 4 protein [Verticiella sediminum]